MDVFLLSCNHYWFHFVAFFFSPWSIIIGSIELEGVPHCFALTCFFFFVQGYLEKQKLDFHPDGGGRWEERDATSVYC